MRLWPIMLGFLGSGAMAVMGVYLLSKVHPQVSAKLPQNSAYRVNLPCGQIDSHFEFMSTEKTGI